MVCDKDTNVEECVKQALSQDFEGKPLKELFKKLKIEGTIVDLGEEPVERHVDSTEELDVGSCDRLGLLKAMLKGSYTESETTSVSDKDTDFILIKGINVHYKLETDEEIFDIPHTCAYVNEDITHIIPLQEESFLWDELKKKEME